MSNFNNSSSNFSSNSSQPPPSSLPSLSLNDVPNYIEFVIRGFDFLVHLSYFLYLGLKPKCELRSRTYLYLHNINLSTFLISIIYMAYIPYSMPSFSNQYTNRVLCLLTELAWSCLKYARVYSLLLLALYRFVGCFYIRLYKKINSRLIYIFASILICWLVSIIIPTIFKFVLSTSYSLYFCIDGFAPRRYEDSIIYYVVNTTLSSAIGTLVIFGLYVKIYRKLKKQSEKISTQTEKTSKMERFSRQFIVLNALTAVSTVFATFVDYVNVIAAYSAFNYLQSRLKVIRPVAQMVLLLFESTIPMVSIYYTVWNWRLVKAWLFRRVLVQHANESVTQTTQNIRLEQIKR